MAKVTGTFYGESRAFVYPLMDLNGVAPFAQVTPTEGGSPLQLTNEGDNSWWRIYGHSACYCTPATGGLASGTLFNMQIKREDTGEDMTRSARFSPNPVNNVNLGPPLEHVAGKAGNPGFMAYAWDEPAGTRLIPLVSHQNATTPTGRSPLYMVAHASLMKNKKLAAKQQLGSKNAQQIRYRGQWRYWTGRFDFTTTSLAINGSDALTININTNQYLLIDTLWCRAVQLGEASPNVWLPNDPFNPCVSEDELLVSLSATNRETPFTTPGYVPLWTLFGQWAARYYHPPTQFIVSPKGSLEINLKNGPTAEIDYALEFTIGGCLIDKDFERPMVAYMDNGEAGG